MKPDPTTRSELTRLLLGSALVDRSTAVNLCAQARPADFASKKARALFLSIKSLVDEGFDPGTRIDVIFNSLRCQDAGVTASDIADLCCESCPTIARAWLDHKGAI
jgi:hypothetical protein